MAMKDIIQYKRKYKKPYLRKWYHNSNGDDTFQQIPLTKTKIAKVLKAKKELVEDIYVAYKGKEYRPKEFAKAHPKLVVMKKILKKRKAKK